MKTSIPFSVWINIALAWFIVLTIPPLVAIYDRRGTDEIATYFIVAIIILFFVTRSMIRQYRAKQAVEKPERKSIIIEYRKGILYFIPIGGSLYQLSDIIILPDSASDEEKASAFWKALELAGKDQPWPTDWKTPSPEMQAFLDRIQLKTWGTYMKYVLHSSITWDRDAKTLSFHISHYERGSFVGTSDDFSVEIPEDASFSKIAQTIRQTLENCTGRDGLKLSDSNQLQSSTQELEPVCYGVCFGYKNCWLAFKTNDPNDLLKIADRLGMKNSRQADWETGVNAAYETSVFITPPVGDWVLAVGRDLFDFCSLEQVNREKLQAWSREFGEVQFFATHRGIDAQAWIKAVNGRIVRAYSWIGESGETKLNEGEPTTMEQGYNFVDTNLPESEDDDYWEREDLFMPDEGFVMGVAASWSVDPMDLESRGGIAEFGLLGKFDK